MRHGKVSDLITPYLLGLFQHFQNKERKLLVMTSKCIKLRICTLSCCAETHCLNDKSNVKVGEKIKTETLKSKVNLVISLKIFCNMNCKLCLRGILSFPSFKSHLQCQCCVFTSEFLEQNTFWAILLTSTHYKGNLKNICYIKMYSL